MKKLIVGLALAALTVPVFAVQSGGQAPAQQQQSVGKKKAAKKSSKRKHKKGQETKPSEQK